MKTRPYTADLPMPDGSIWQSIECEIVASLEFEDGEPTLSIDDVLIDVSGYREPSRYVSMTSEGASPLMAMTGHEIRQIAEADDELLAEVMQAAGIFHVGGVNDPDSRFARFG